MNVEYYAIRGRGPDGKSFQLAKLRDDQGKAYKGEYDQARQFQSESELKTYIADVVKCPAEELTISPLVM